METVTDARPAETEAVETPDAERNTPQQWRERAKSIKLTPRWLAAIFIGIYVLGGLYVTARLWRDIDNRVTAYNVGDFAFFEFAFAHAAHAQFNWENPLFNANLNAPLGVNMMANTSMFGLTIPLSPVTLLWGTKPALGMAIVIGLAGTATAWYFFLLRHITERRWLAFVAAGFIGFAPGMISQANAHPNITAQFMVPLIISRVLRLKEPGRVVRNGLILGLMIVFQLFINEEVLFYTALICAAFVIVLAISRPKQARALAGRYAGGVAIAAALALLVMAYPLWFQFFGPQHYTGPFEWAAIFGTDISAFTRYSSESLGGFSGHNPVATNVAEENAFFGWPLCLLFAGFSIVYWRNLIVRAAAVCGMTAGALSLGQELTRNGNETGIPGPWKLVAGLPLFDSIIVTRMAIMMGPAIAIVLVVAAQKFIPALQATTPGFRRPIFTFSACVLVASLLPLFPTPITATYQAPVQAFFTQGTWRDYISNGHAIPVPPDPAGTDALRWLVATEMRLPVADGYFLGPTSKHNPVATYGSPKRETGELLRLVSEEGEVPRISEADRRQALADLRSWQADVLVLAPQKHFNELRRTVNQLLMLSGESKDGVWVWDVRRLRS